LRASSKSADPRYAVNIAPPEDLRTATTLAGKAITDLLKEIE
jgi:hypothetical protein